MKLVGIERVCGREKRRGLGRGAGGGEAGEAPSRPSLMDTLCLWVFSARFSLMIGWPTILPRTPCPAPTPPSSSPFLPFRSPLDVGVRTTARVPLVGALMAYASEMLATLTEYYTYTSGS